MREPELLSDKDTKNCKVYFVDDDRGVIHSSVQWLTLSGINVAAFADPKLLLKTIRPNEACVVVSDIRMPDLDGMSLMKHIHTRDKDMPVILITGHGDIPLAVEAIKLGAFEFVTKPFSPEGLLATIEKAQKHRMAFLGQQQDQHAPVREVVETTSQPTAEPEEQPVEEVGPLNSRVDDYERSIIVTALKKHAGDIAAVMEDLDLPRRTLNAKMKKYGLNRRDFRSR